MPNRDGGQDTRHDPNRQVGYSRWQPANYPDNGALRSGSDSKFDQRNDRDAGMVQVNPTKYGYEAEHTRWTPDRMSRTEEFHQARYSAGPFRTEHRAKVAALGLATREDDQLERYRS